MKMTAQVEQVTELLIKMDESMTEAEEREEKLKQQSAKQQEANRRLEDKMQSQEKYINSLKTSHEESMKQLESEMASRMTAMELEITEREEFRRKCMEEGHQAQLDAVNSQLNHLNKMYDKEKYESTARMEQMTRDFNARLDDLKNRPPKVIVKRRCSIM